MLVSLELPFLPYLLYNFPPKNDIITHKIYGPHVALAFLMSLPPSQDVNTALICHYVITCLEIYTHLNAELQRIASRDKKAFLRHQCKEIEENNRMGIDWE